MKFQKHKWSIFFPYLKIVNLSVKFLALLRASSRPCICLKSQQTPAVVMTEIWMNKLQFCHNQWCWQVRTDNFLISHKSHTMWETLTSVATKNKIQPSTHFYWYAISPSNWHQNYPFLFFVPFVLSTTYGWFNIWKRLDFKLKTILSLYQACIH